MNALTYFSAYQRFESMKDCMVSNRKGSWGIAVDEDYFARQWQKWDLRQRRAEYHLRQKLGDPNVKRQYCPHCCWWIEVCQCPKEEK